MEFRRNIIFSAVLHAMIIIAVFAVSVRDMTERLRTDYLTVSLFKEMIGTTSMTPQSTKKDEDKISSVIVKSVIVKREAIKQSPPPHPPPQGRVREGVYKEGIASPELDLSNKTRFFANSQNDKDEGARNDTSTYHSLLNTTSEISKGDTSISPGQHADKSEEITPSQNTGFSLIKSSHQGDTRNPYALIRAAIEKAKTYPFLARKKRIEGTVITDFTINSKGYPQDIKIGKSSGSEILDSAAIKIVMKAAPFPLVDGEIAVPISFKLTGYPPSYISSR